MSADSAPKVTEIPAGMHSNGVDDYVDFGDPTELPVTAAGWRDAKGWHTIQITTDDDGTRFYLEGKEVSEEEIPFRLGRGS